MEGRLGFLITASFFGFLAICSPGEVETVAAMVLSVASILFACSTRLDRSTSTFHHPV
jgi:hypothetical protein